MKKYLGFTLVVVGVFFLGTVFFQPEKCGAGCINSLVSSSPADFKAALSASGGTLLDIRTAEEYASGHLAGSVNADFYQTEKFSAFLDSLDKTKPYLIYCRTGNRSGQALQLMKQKGFTRVMDLSGGITAWQSAGLPVTK